MLFKDFLDEYFNDNGYDIIVYDYTIGENVFVGQYEDLEANPILMDATLNSVEVESKTICFNVETTEEE